MPSTIIIDGESLTLDDIASVANGARVEITRDPEIRERAERSRKVVADKIARGEPIYGVTTLYGALADQYVSGEDVKQLQKLALWHHRSATGPRLPVKDVRAAMLLRANSLIKGASGIRLEIIERFATFLNNGVHPHVYQRGSIGASGDLVPLSYIAGCIVGLDKAFLVEIDGETVDCLTALARLGLEPLELQPKEGLALNNGTGACTGVAANAAHRATDLVALALGVHALYAQALLATDQSFAPFIHRMKPHPGQVWTAARMAELIDGGKTIVSESGGDRSHRPTKLIQDRYSLRCLPQYIGPIIDGLATVVAQLEIEINSANDNPLIDPDRGEILHTGNFLAEYTATSMDQLRYFLGLLTSHLDAQIALLMTPEFSNGLPASLVGNTAQMNVGFKSVQVAGNCLMPLIGFYGNSIADRYPSHAEQFNQNINSQAMNSANLARDVLDLVEHYMSVALLCGIQAVEIRAKMTADTFDARAILSPATQPLYQAARSAALGAPDANRPVHWNDLDDFIQDKVEGLLSDISVKGPILQAMAPVSQALRQFIRSRT